MEEEQFTPFTKEEYMSDANNDPRRIAQGICPNVIIAVVAGDTVSFVFRTTSGAAQFVAELQMRNGSKYRVAVNPLNPTEVLLTLLAL